MHSICAKLLEFASQGSDGIECLAVASLVAKGEVDVEHVLPLLPDDGQTLYFCQVELVEGEDRQDGAQAAFLVGEGEDEARLVDGASASDGRCLLGVSKDEEAREVVLVRLDAILQHLHAVDVGSVAVADGGVSVSLLAADVGCSTCRVGRFHYLQPRVSREELAALHECDGMGVHLLDVVPTLIGQTHDAVLDA